MKMRWEKRTLSTGSTHWNVETDGVFQAVGYGEYLWPWWFVWLLYRRINRYTPDRHSLLLLEDS